MAPSLHLLHSRCQPICSSAILTIWVPCQHSMFNILFVILITFCQRLSRNVLHWLLMRQSTVLLFIVNRQQAGFVVDCWSCCAFLSYGLLTSPEWVCTMGGCVIYNLHACSTFTKVGGPGVQLHGGQGNSYMVSR